MRAYRDQPLLQHHSEPALLDSGGHLLLSSVVVQSFQAFPVGPEPFAFLRLAQPQTWGLEVFRLGLWIATPMIAMLLFVNLVLGIISRVASHRRWASSRSASRSP